MEQGRKGALCSERRGETGNILESSLCQAYNKHLTADQLRWLQQGHILRGRMEIFYLIFLVFWLQYSHSLGIQGHKLVTNGSGLAQWQVSFGPQGILKIGKVLHFSHIKTWISGFSWKLRRPGNPGLHSCVVEGARGG